MVVIDVFSKYVGLRKLKDKKGDSVAFALKDIIKGGRKYNRFKTDKGQEIRSKSVQRLFKSTGIQHIYALNEVKAAVIKTMKKNTYRFFAYKKRTST